MIYRSSVTVAVARRLVVPTIMHTCTFGDGIFL